MWCHGWVQTQLGNLRATMAGILEAPVTFRDSVEGLVAQVGLGRSTLMQVGLVVVLTFVVLYRSTKLHERKRPADS